MKLSEDFKSITYMKTKSADLVKKVSTTGRPMVITQNGEPKVIILDVKSYEKEKEAFLLLQFLNKRSQQIQKNGGIPHEEVMKRMDKIISKHSR